MSDERFSVWVTSGVSAFTGQGFCTIELHRPGHVEVLGQLDPEQVRQMALAWLGAAEAAEHDAAVFAELVETAGLDEATAGTFIAHLRDRRPEPPSVGG
jgi:hypothetical protein